MTLNELNERVDAKRGKRGGWPAHLQYSAVDDESSVNVIISDMSTGEGNIWKSIDPWGFAFLDEVAKVTSKELEMTFRVQSPTSGSAAYKYEAFKRRISYLSATNNLKIKLVRAGCIDPLYSMKDLTVRPDAEIVRDDFRERGHDDEAGRLEKDFQAYLFGKGKSVTEEIVRTNERLALFGPDFLRVGKVKDGGTKEGYVVEREFPTGAFLCEIKECNRILNTEYVDLVTLNRYGDLAVIEIKFDGSPLEVISQVLNYSLHFHSYRSKLNPSLTKRFGEKVKDANLVTYLVSNVFHKRFDSVWKYYSNGNLTLKQVVMGFMPSKS